MTKTTSFARVWRASTQSRKQRLYRYSAPLHVKQSLMHAHLSVDLRKKYGLRAVQVRKGDKVKVLRGQFTKKEGKVERVDLKRERIYIYGMDALKKDGSKVAVPLRASVVMITELDLGDALRRTKLESFKKSDTEGVIPNNTNLRNNKVKK